jgi:hypothetical protein
VRLHLSRAPAATHSGAFCPIPAQFQIVPAR